jgi:uncharacterized protein YjbJ (UPF0337 family)
MDIIELKGDWELQKQSLKQKVAKLTENDLFHLDGNKEEMLGKLQITLGKSKEELQLIFDNL